MVYFRLDIKCNYQSQNLVNRIIGKKMLSETEHESSQTDYTLSETDEFTDSFIIQDDDEYAENNLLSSSQQNIVVNQYGQDVIDFSSQYGSDSSISYTAYNITGRPSKFPDYGDFPETFAMRTYGKWWDIAPSKQTEIMPHTLPDVIVHDYIVVKFEECVCPEKILIFETYNPGSIIKIWAFTVTEKWVCLWQGVPDIVIKEPRMFSPIIKKIQIPTNILRLEFNHSCLDYFTEIDGILMIGRKYNSINLPELLPICSSSSSSNALYRQRGKGPITRKLETICFKPLILENHENILRDFLDNDLQNFIIESGIVPDENDCAQFTLKDLPCEIIFKIFSYLDLESLFIASQVCRKLHDIAVDPSLYTEVNLRPYWHLVNRNVLLTLSERCRLIRKFDISWCGLFKDITSCDFINFITNCGKNLTHLRLNSVKFLNYNCLDSIGINCNLLQELSLRNFTCSVTNTVKFTALTNLKNLERIDFFRASIDLDVLLSILKNNPNLKHINLAYYGHNVSMDNIAIHISDYNTNVISIDMWKASVLSSVGLLALSNCKYLEEVDFGWCLRDESSPGESLKSLLKGCTKLKKLFLAAIRGLTDRDLDAIVNYCPNLEQLDLMGVMGISTDKCFEILKHCKHLKLLDLSFCEHIDDIQINVWRDIFNVSIIRNFVAIDLNP